MMDILLQRELARLLATLRREGLQQSGLDPRLVPPDKATAYRVAQMVAEELGWGIAGWKIAAMKAEMQQALRTDSPIYGRVFAPMVKASPISVAHATLCSPIPEVEYQARLGADLPPRAKPYTEEEVTEAVTSWHPGLELAACRFIHDAAFPPLPAILADGAGFITTDHRRTLRPPLSSGFPWPGHRPFWSRCRSAGSGALDAAQGAAV
jgi:2-keto-4-pentenoate hydratase